LQATKARVAAGGLLALLVWQAGVAVGGEYERVSPALTTVGEHHVLLAAVRAHATDIRRLIVVREPSASVLRPAGLLDAEVDRSVVKDLLIAHLTTLLFPIIVQDLPGLTSGTSDLVELLEPTTYVLDLRDERTLAQLSALSAVAAGDGYELLRYDPDR
jgi:hypothetical protein